MTKLSIVSLCWTALAFVALAPAQEIKQAPKAAATPKPGCCVQQVYQVKHVNVGDLYRLIFTRPEQGTTLDMRYSEQLKAISIYGTPQEVNSIMANLKALDVAAGPGYKDGSASITIWLVAASALSDPAATPPPAEIQPVLNVIAPSFGYKTFRLLDSVIALSKAGGNFVSRGNARSASQKLQSQSRGMANYTASAEAVRIESSGTARVVRFDRFILRLQAPYCSDSADPACRQVANSSVEMSGSFDVRDGQKVVVGKSKLDGGDNDLILIVSAKVVD